MHRRCCFFCQSLPFKVPGLILHNFPNDLSLRKIWLRRCGYTEEEFVPNSKLCSLHFDGNSYKNTKSRKLLKKNSIPTKFKKVSKFNFVVECEQSSSEMTMNMSVQTVECEQSTSQDMTMNLSVQTVECEQTTSEDMTMNVSDQIECEQHTLEEMTMNVSVQNILETPKRQKRHCYIGDIATPDLSTPKRAKKHLNLAKLQILKQRRKIKTLQQRVNRLQKKLYMI